MYKIPEGVSVDSRTYISDDGFVFLTGGRNRVLDLYDGDSFAGMVPAQYWMDTAAARQRFFEALGIPWRMMFVPEKLSVYGNALFPDMGTDAMPTPGQRMVHLLPTTPITYPLAALNKEKRNELVYLRTDSHWNPFGAFVAFQALMRDSGIEIDTTIYDSLERREIEWKGDLWSAETEHLVPDQLVRFTVPSYIHRVYCSPSVGIQEKLSPDGLSGLHIGCHTIHVNSKAQIDKTVILFGSSFSSFALEHNLMTFWFSLFFRCVHFIWSGNLDLDYIMRHSPNLVFIEMPERFPTACPPDSFSVDDCSSDKSKIFHELRLLADKK